MFVFAHFLLELATFDQNLMISASIWRISPIRGLEYRSSNAPFCVFRIILDVGNKVSTVYPLQMAVSLLERAVLYLALSSIVPTRSSPPNASCFSNSPIKGAKHHTIQQLSNPCQWGKV